MEPVTNTIATIITKPSVGIISAFGGGISSVLTAIGILSPIIGFVATCLGLVIAIFHLKIVYRRWKEHKD